MPNPLLNALPRNISRRTPADVRIEPVPEEYEGDNNPYRGIESHGVEPTADPRPVPGHSEGRPVVYDAPQEEPEPLPVVIRSEHGRELRRSRFYHEYASPNTTNPRRIVSDDDGRTKVTIQNISDEDVWIGDTAETANSVHGWRLRNLVTSPHIVFESTTQKSLYALSTTADQKELAIVVEYASER